MSKYVEAKVKIMSDFKNNEYNLSVLILHLIATSSIVRPSHRQQHRMVKRGKSMGPIDSRRET